jgi:lysophospholipase L1-like esterase
MCRYSRFPLLVLLFVSSLITSTALGQSLALYRNSTNKTWLEATSSSDIGYRLQASVDFNNWEDISDQASGPFSLQIDTTRNANSFFRLRTWTTLDVPINLVLVGDSTVADFAVNNSQSSGWGQGIYGYLKPNVRAINLAVALQSTKVFLTSIQKDYMVKIKPDFVLIAFGGVDAGNWPDYHTTLEEYEANLKKIVQLIRDFKGTPILVTPSNARYFDSAGKVIPFMEERIQIVKKAAVDSQTYLIDLNQLTINLYNDLGETKSTYITWSDEDRHHFSLKGADVIAELVVKAFPNILRPHVIQN